MCLGLQSRVRRWLVARVTPPPPAPPPAHALACLLLTSRSLSLSPSLFGQSLLLATTTPFPPCPYPLTRGPDGGYLSESGEQIAWKNLLRGYLPTYQPTYLPTYLSTSLAIYMHLSNVPSPTHVHRTRNLPPYPFGTSKCISARRATDRIARLSPFRKCPRTQYFPQANCITIDNERKTLIDIPQSVEVNIVSI